MPASAVSFFINPISFPASGDGLILTPGPAARSVEAPVLVSMDTRRVSLPGSGAGRRFARVCSLVMQYAITWLLSLIHLGLPQKSPLLVIFFNPEPSG